MAAQQPQRAKVADNKISARLYGRQPRNVASCLICIRSEIPWVLKRSFCVFPYVLLKQPKAMSSLPVWKWWMGVPSMSRQCWMSSIGGVLRFVEMVCCSLSRKSPCQEVTHKGAEWDRGLDHFVWLLFSGGLWAAI